MILRHIILSPREAAYWKPLVLVLLGFAAYVAILSYTYSRC